MLEREVGNPLDFFTWVLKSWDKVASANRRSKARQAKETKSAQAEMSLSPSFNELAFKAPYFITFYNDREQAAIVEERVITEKATKTATVATASQAAIAARRERVRLEDIEREEMRKAAAAVPRLRRTRSVEIDDDEVPQFKEQVWEAK
jgi:hypothetical protein